MQQVTPKVYLIGSTTIDKETLKSYLTDTGNLEFLDILTGVDMMDIVSFYAKLCYKSLSLGHNKNVTRIRDIKDNFISIIESNHGAVLEHATVNFVAENVSRVETTEQLRHRVGTAYSGESSRYCHSAELKFWYPQIAEMHTGLKSIMTDVVVYCEKRMQEAYNSYIPMCTTFEEKKTLTSAIRRMKPVGCAETLGFSLNLRAARHIIGLRTSEHAEEEIRIVFGQVAEILKEKIPLLFVDCKETLLHGITKYEFTGVKQ